MRRCCRCLCPFWGGVDAGFGNAIAKARGSKSFLLLFFKKEALLICQMADLWVFLT
jgi:hypothetical protein